MISLCTKNYSRPLYSPSVVGFIYKPYFLDHPIYGHSVCKKKAMISSDPDGQKYDYM